MRIESAQSRTTGRPCRGFTMIELLVVIGVVLTLLGILIVAVAGATKTAQKTNTRALMNSIKQGMHQFRTDIGYLPPVLGALKVHSPASGPGTPEGDLIRGLFDPRGDDGIWDGGGDDILPQGPGGQANPEYRRNVQLWFSFTSPAEYLLGYGSRENDGYGDNDIGSFPDERPPLGIRSPGSDGVWGATVYDAEDGSFGARMKGPGGNQNVGTVAGKVYGPYLQLKDPDLLASTDGTYDASGRLRVMYPGDPGYLADNPKVIVDYWGNAISFYRQLYAPGALTSPYRTFGAARQPTLSDVFVLRPFEIKPGTGIDGLGDFSQADYLNGQGDPTTTAALSSAEFALFSTGPDGAWNPFIRYDNPDDPGNDPNQNGRPTSFANEDNIVELGP